MWAAHKLRRVEKKSDTMRTNLSPKLSLSLCDYTIAKSKSTCNLEPPTGCRVRQTIRCQSGTYLTILNPKTKSLSAKKILGTINVTCSWLCCKSQQRSASARFDSDTGLANRAHGELTNTRTWPNCELDFLVQTVSLAVFKTDFDISKFKLIPGSWDPEPITSDRGYGAFDHCIICFTLSGNIIVNETYIIMSFQVYCFSFSG